MPEDRTRMIEAQIKNELTAELYGLDNVSDAEMVISSYMEFETEASFVSKETADDKMVLCYLSRYGASYRILLDAETGNVEDVSMKMASPVEEEVEELPSREELLEEIHQLKDLSRMLLEKASGLEEKLQKLL